MSLLRKLEMLKSSLPFLLQHLRLDIQRILRLGLILLRLGGLGRKQGVLLMCLFELQKHERHFQLRCCIVLVCKRHDIVGHLLIQELLLSVGIFHLLKFLWWKR